MNGLNVEKTGDKPTALTQAHAWRHKLLNEDVTEAQRAEFEHWYDSNDLNRAAYAETLTFWDALPHVHTAIAPELLKPTLFERAYHALTRLKEVVFARTLMVSLASVTAVFFIALLTFYQVDETANQAQQAQHQIFESKKGEVMLVQLDDGSQVTLGPDSGIKAVFSATTRNIELIRGAAFFEVEKDRGRPFLVSTNHFTVTVTGTAFDVENNGGILRTRVAQGSVEVQYPFFVNSKPSGYKFTETLNQGQGAKVSSRHKLIKLEQVNTNTIAAWRQNKLIYEGNSLVEIVAELNRYSDMPIEISEQLNAEALKLRGGFSTHKIADILEVIASVHDLHIQHHPDEKIVIQQKI